MKKGFTLVEIIGVVIVLGLIALLAFPQILKLIKNTNSGLNEATEKIILAAAGQYTSEHADELPTVTGNVYCITIRDLVTNDYLQESITSENLGDHGLDTNVKVTVNGGKYEYEVTSECTPASSM